jgi:hypothetical protein
MKREEHDVGSVRHHFLWNSFSRFAGGQTAHKAEHL